jgi:hypothetical protein
VSTLVQSAARAANAVIDAIRRHIAVRPEVLKAAKHRRDLVRDLATAHPAARAGYNSGSVAHGTANAPLNDTDCGVVLDRRKFPEFGPDGDDRLPGGRPFSGRCRPLSGRSRLGWAAPVAARRKQVACER